MTVHKNKKLTGTEWARAVRAGHLKTAILSTKPRSKKGPWSVLCDNEGFLNAALSTKAHRAAKCKLLRIPRRSPDLNPVEKFWGWLRKHLRAKDLRDATNRRPALSKPAYIRRVRQVCRSKKAQQVAGAYARGLRAACRQVIKNKGAAIRG